MKDIEFPVVVTAGLLCMHMLEGGCVEGQPHTGPPVCMCIMHVNSISLFFDVLKVLV